MPTTYLLLRNNKQTGPHSLEELLHQALQPHDLVWVEGQSAGWHYPSEIAALKPLLEKEKAPEQGPHASNASAQKLPAAHTAAPPAQSNHSHIYVALPAGRTAPEETVPESSLEAKAEALYQRVQAYAQGRPTGDKTDTHYARTLDDMKQEYGTWLTQQQKKKKHSGVKKKLLIAASVLVVTTSGFGVGKWISSQSGLEKPTVPYTLGAAEAAHKEPVPVLVAETADTFISHNEAPALQRNLPETGAALKTTKKPIATHPIKATSTKINAGTVTNDTVSHATPPPTFTATPRVEDEVKKVVPLSRLVTVNGAVQYDRKGTSITGAEVTLQNNSPETLKQVTVVVTYYKKEDRPVSKETLSFYNVQPASAPAIKANPNRKAASARFQIGAITRADGSLYLIH